MIFILCVPVRVVCENRENENESTFMVELQMYANGTNLKIICVQFGHSIFGANANTGLYHKYCMWMIVCVNVKHLLASEWSSNLVLNFISGDFMVWQMCADKRDLPRKI